LEEGRGEGILTSAKAELAGIREGERQRFETNLLFRLRFPLNDKAVFVICLLSS
jgi:hypothetical protein